MYFNSLLLKYLEDIIVACQVIADIYYLFDETQRIRPIQCDQAVDSIQVLEKPVENLCKIIEKSSSLPIVIIPNCYKLLIPLHYINERTCQLPQLINELRPICLESSSQRKKLQQKIQKQLDLLLQAAETLKEEREVLFQHILLSGEHKHLFQATKNSCDGSVL